LSHRPDPIQPPGKHFMDVTLVADIEDKLVLRRFEDPMERNGQLDHSEVRAEVAAGLRQHFDQFVADFLGKLRQFLFVERLDIRWRMDPI
jgi:hypothetical protein